MDGGVDGLGFGGGFDVVGGERGCLCFGVDLVDIWKVVQELL